MPTANSTFETRAVALMAAEGLGRLCDYGCGDGEGLRRMARRLPGDVRLTGIDLFDRFTERSRPAEEGRIRFLDRESAAFDALHQRGDAFDLVVSAFTLHHFEHPVRELQCIERLVAPGGYLFVWDLRFSNETRGEIMRTIVSFLSEVRQGLAGGYHRHHYSLSQALDLFAALDMEVLAAEEERIDIPGSEAAEAVERLVKTVGGTPRHAGQRAGDPLLEEYFRLLTGFLLENLPKYGIDDSPMFSILARKAPRRDDWTSAPP